MTTTRFFGFVISMESYWVPLELPCEKNGPRSVKILGSCDGLVCLASKEGDIFIWNPSTRQHNKLSDRWEDSGCICYCLFTSEFFVKMFKNSYFYVLIFVCSCLLFLYFLRQIIIRGKSVVSVLLMVMAMVLMTAFTNLCVISIVVVMILAMIGPLMITSSLWYTPPVSDQIHELRDCLAEKQLLEKRGYKNLTQVMMEEWSASVLFYWTEPFIGSLRHLTCRKQNDFQSSLLIWLVRDSKRLWCLAVANARAES